VLRGAARDDAAAGEWRSGHGDRTRGDTWEQPKTARDGLLQLCFVEARASRRDRKRASARASHAATATAHRPVRRRTRERTPRNNRRIRTRRRASRTHAPQRVPLEYAYRSRCDIRRRRARNRSRARPRGRSSSPLVRADIPCAPQRRIVQPPVLPDVDVDAEMAQCRRRVTITFRGTQRAHATAGGDEPLQHQNGICAQMIRDHRKGWYYYEHNRFFWPMITTL